MRSPTTRVLAVLELLQTHRRLSGTELAQRLNVDGRTLRRYIGRLEELYQLAINKLDIMLIHGLQGDVDEKPDRWRQTDR